MALLLIGCQADGRLATFSAGDVKTDVKLPDVCEAFLQPVAVPKFSHKANAIAAFGIVSDKLDEANTRLSIGGDCARDERGAYLSKSGK